MKKVLFLINGFGDLEWAAPLIKDCENNNILVEIFFPSSSFRNILSTSTLLEKRLAHLNKADLYSLFFDINFLENFIRHISKVRFIDKIVRRIIVFFLENFSAHYSTKLIKSSNPDFIFHDISKDTSFRLSVKEKLIENKGEIFVHPHGSEVFVETAPDFIDVLPNYLLAANEITASVYKKNYPNAIIIISGIPKLREKWIPNKKRIQNLNIKKILFIARGPHHQDLSVESYEKIIEGLLEEVKKFENIQLIIKPHPRYGSKDLVRRLKFNKIKNWKIFEGSIMEITDDIDLAISMWSTLIIDCISIGIPTIEYFIYECKPDRWLKEKNEVISGYKKYGLAEHISEHKQLKDYFDMSNEELKNLNSTSKTNLKKIHNIWYNDEIINHLTKNRV